MNLVDSSQITGFGGILKSWISPSSCCIHHQHKKQTWPQLVQTNTNFYPGFGCECERTPRLAEPYSNNDRYMEFTNFIEFQDKYYAISLQGCLALVEDKGNSGILKITALGRNPAVPYCKACRHYREYLLEYEGEIYLVFLLSRASIDVVDGVEVFELDRLRLLWKKVDRLKRDAMFFVEDKCCLGISASSLRCRGNCVYFAQERADHTWLEKHEYSWIHNNNMRGNCVYITHARADHTWFVYDMNTSCISSISRSEIVHPVCSN